MAEFIGLVLLGAAIALLALLTPWFRRHEDSRLVESWMLGELAALVIVACLISGVSLVVKELFTAWTAHDLAHVGISIGGIVVFALVARAVSRWLSRQLLYTGATPAA